MQESTIEELAYLLKEAKKGNINQPIVFLGAGASKSGGIPLAGDIVSDILKDYKDNPTVKKDKDKSYTSLMNCLLPQQRNNLLKGYIDNAKINVTHIYLAQLIKNDFIDYVLTVNFDNLMLRALALYNIYPPTYDMAVLKDLTTSTFPKKSVVYLHGQHHGLWLLNTDEELKKVNEVIPPILNSIKDRPWIFVGYSGNDPIFKHLIKLGRFDNGLYWVSYKDSIPSDCILENLLEKENTNSYLIKGFDSDSFMIKLNSELKLDQPEILEEPFTFLQKSLDNIVDIEDEENFKGVKERLEIVKKQVNEAIDIYEKGNSSKKNTKEEIDIDLLKKEIIDILLSYNFDENKINKLLLKVKKVNNFEINNLTSNLFNLWGINIKKVAESKNDEKLYKEAFKKYKKASELNPKDDSIFNNWGNALCNLTKSKNDEKLYKEAFEKYKKASELNPKDDFIFYNWGNALYNLAKSKNDEKLYEEAFEKYKKASELNPKDDSIFNNWGSALSDLAESKNDEKLYEEAFEKYKKASELNPKDDSIFNNWGSALSDLAESKNDEKLYKEAFEKYKKASELNPKDDSIFNNWGSALYNLAKSKNDENLYKEAFEKYKKASELNPKDDSIFYNWGTTLSNLAESKNDENLYKEAFEKYKKASELNPKDDSIFYNWGNTLSNLAKLKNDEKLYEEAFEKYKKAFELNQKNDSIFNNWGNALSNLAKLKNDDKLYEEAYEKLQKAVDLGGDSYNLSCYYSLRGIKSKALELLEKNLIDKAISVEQIEEDEDWDNFKDDSDFIELLNKYKK
ncbi:TPR end-of-group domain-containing protein [Arcobacter sp.]|uniref:TPR end-of-group domain-containing protein n=1 Tax=unclassified Arcobacter TaxID=2593671 RepID=UPI003AFF8159